MGFAVCCAVLTAFDDLGGWGVIFVCIARMSISLSFMAIYIYFSEFFPTVIRSTAIGCASACGRFAGILTSFIAQDLSIRAGMAIYGVSGVVAYVCTSMLQQDTLGKDLATSIQPQNIGALELGKYQKVVKDKDTSEFVAECP